MNEFSKKQNDEKRQSESEIIEDDYANNVN